MQQRKFFNVKFGVPRALSTTNLRERNAVYSGRYTPYHIPQDGYLL
jgi:hypothetical protein